MNTFIQDAIFETSEKLRLQKEALILERLGNYMRGGDKIDFEKESQRLFPRLKCVYRADDKSENWYWNNGMENGYHLISFFPEDPKPFDKLDPNKFVIGFKYI